MGFGKIIKYYETLYTLGVRGAWFKDSDLLMPSCRSPVLGLDGAVGQQHTAHR